MIHLVDLHVRTDYIQIHSIWEIDLKSDHSNRGILLIKYSKPENIFVHC